MEQTAETKAIRLSEETKKRLDSLKVHPRQSYEEVINKLVDEHNKK